MKKKYILLAILLLIVIGVVLFLCLKKDNKVTIQDIRELISEKGENLTWTDFEKYKSKEIGSGLYILLYEVNDTFDLMIGGVLNEKPMYIRLVSKENNDKYIDIRYDNLETFIKSYK